MSEPQPDDVTVASYALAPLRAVGDADPRWSQPAVPTKWTAAQAVAHIPDALLFYAGQVARRADHRMPVLRDGRAAPPSEQLDNAVTAAHVLAGLLPGLGSQRAWHPSGLADASGWPEWPSPSCSFMVTTSPAPSTSTCPFPNRSAVAPSPGYFRGCR